MQYRVRKLRTRHRVILQYIYDSTRLHGYAPTFREIGQATGITSSSVVTYNIKQLTEWGFLHRLDGASRAITLSEAGYRVIEKHPLADLLAEVARLTLENQTLRERCERLEHLMTLQSSS